ncbi:MAG TPA: hypothetical protein VFE37_30175 [Chloroflexota bacterium]|nr:hypothetical protein [Chloroflexota bacterium]
MPVRLRVQGTDFTFTDPDGPRSLLGLFGLDWFTGEVGALRERSGGALSPAAAQRLLVLLAEREELYRLNARHVPVVPPHPRSVNEALVYLHSRYLALQELLRAAIERDAPVQVLPEPPGEAR